MEQINRILRNLMCLPIFLYRWLLKPVIKPCCRYYPSCSQYAIAAVRELGIFKGGWFAMRRLMRCHPWTKGGYDPVLPNEEKL